jgi:hypothetical protein
MTAIAPKAARSIAQRARPVPSHSCEKCLSLCRCTQRDDVHVDRDFDLASIDARFPFKGIENLFFELAIGHVPCLSGAAQIVELTSDRASFARAGEPLTIVRGSETICTKPYKRARLRAWLAPQPDVLRHQPYEAATRRFRDRSVELQRREKSGA